MTQYRDTFVPMLCARHKNIYISRRIYIQIRRFTYHFEGKRVIYVRRTAFELQIRVAAKKNFRGIGGVA